jgi:hypothetical protein
MYAVKENTFEARSFQTVSKTLGLFDSRDVAQKEVKRVVLRELAMLNNEPNMTIDEIDCEQNEFRAVLNHENHAAVMWMFVNEKEYYPIKYYNVEEVVENGV